MLDSSNPAILSFMPKVSIITATYNAMRFFAETVRSVLGNGFEDFEWIIVDDASADGTMAYLGTINDARVRVVVNKVNLGVHSSYSAGVSEATGKYILILDHDDTIPEGSLEKRVKLLDRYPQCALAFGPVNYMTEQGAVYRTSKFHFIKSRTVVAPFKILIEIFLSPAYPIKQGCVLLRRTFVEKMSGKYDIELFLGISYQYPVAATMTPCLNYRTFRGQRSAENRLRWRRFFQFVWGRYAIRFLPWYISPFVILYRTLLELLKNIWMRYSSRRI